MSRVGPQRRFAAMQHDLGSGGLSGRSADATGTGAPQGPKAKQPCYAIAMKDGAPFDLPASERATVMAELELMGINAGSLFPGLDGACEQLKERFFK
jgi:hypothetical protein